MINTKQIKLVLIDADGVLVHGERFSERLAREHDISVETTAPFFKNDFPKCIIGKANLRGELGKHLEKWGWRGSMSDLLDYWFADEAHQIERRLLPLIAQLRAQGIDCCLATNNERLRTDDLVQTKGLGKNFDRIFSSGYLGVKKPDVAYFETVMKSYPKVTRKEVMLWDDDPENIEAAAKFGFQSHLYANFGDFKKVIDRLLS